MRANPSVCALLLSALLASACGSGGAATAVVAAPAPALAPVERVLALAREDNRVQEHLRHLSYSIGPRLTGSPGLAAAEAWCRARFEEWGLEAELERWGEFPVGFARGASSGALLEPEHEELVFTTPAWTPGTDGPRRGPALAWPADQAALDALRERLAGAWVVAPAARGESEWREAVEAALVESGAAGLITPSRGELVHTGGNHRVDPEDLPRLVRIVLRGDQHEALSARVAANEAVSLEFDVDNRFLPGPVPLHNVVADLEGTELPDEYVIVCGHLDTWDGAQGAVDNGTGVSTAMEAARLLAASGVRPRRTIRFILWSGEEQGLLGSEAWVEAHADEMERISAVLNHDGGTNYLAGLGVTPEMMPLMSEVCAPLGDLAPHMPFELREVEAISGMSSSDHAPFVQAGVPGFFWIQAGRSDYDRHHHTQYDTFDAAIPAYQRHSAAVVAVTALGLADAETLLERRNMAPLEPRRMGVQLDGARVSELTEGGVAAAAGWQVDDVIVSIEGEPAGTSRREIQRAIQRGGPVKTVVIERAGAQLETRLDWSAEPAELERERRAAERAAQKRE
jgi:carboxypeptidase Q